MSHTIIVHTATEDAATTFYKEIASGSVTGLADHATRTLQVLEIDDKIASLGEQKKYISGERVSVFGFYRTYGIAFLRATHKASSVDVADLDDFIISVLNDKRKKIWIDTSAYDTATGRSAPLHTAGFLLPVVVDSIAGTEKNTQEGTARLSVQFSHRWDNL